MIPNAEFQKLSTEERTALLKRELDAGPPPALIAYVDGEAAGWVRVGPRIPQVRIARTREIAAATTSPSTTRRCGRSRASWCARSIAGSA